MREMILYHRCFLFDVIDMKKAAIGRNKKKDGK